VTVDEDFAGAVARASRLVRPQPTDKSFLERRLERCLAYELEELYAGRVRPNKKLVGVAIPDWEPQPGLLDIAVLDEGGAPWLVVEIKLDDVDHTIWDIFKLASATRLPSVEAAYMVTAAPAAVWSSSLPAVEFYEARSERAWHSQFVFEQYTSAWAGLLKGGRGRPSRVPDTLLLTPLLTVAVDAYPGYELRVLRVADLDSEAFIELRDGWPTRLDAQEIPDHALKQSDLPATDAGGQAYQQFALTTNGYKRMGSFERCGALANGALENWRATRELPTTLADLRCCLFFEQRRWHHFGSGFDEETLQYVQALVTGMRPLVGEVE
jgi:hypothetical protein